MVERFNRTLMESLSCLVKENPQEWEFFLPHAVFAFRTSFHTSLGCSPYEAAFGLPPRTVLDVHFGVTPRSGLAFTERLRRGVHEIYPSIRTSIETKQAKWKHYHDRRVNANPFQVGDSVVLFCPRLEVGVPSKLQSKFSPGFVVKKVISEWNYVVSNGRFTTLVHRDRLRKLPSRSPHLTINPALLQQFPCFSSPKLPSSISIPKPPDDGQRPYSPPSMSQRTVEPSQKSSPRTSSPERCPRTISEPPQKDVHLGTSPQVDRLSTRRRLPPDRLIYDVMGGRNLS